MSISCLECSLILVLMKLDRLRENSRREAVRRPGGGRKNDSYVLIVGVFRVELGPAFEPVLAVAEGADVAYLVE